MNKGIIMLQNKRKKLNNSLSLKSVKSLKNSNKKIIKENRFNLNSGEKYLYPVVSTMTGATFNIKNLEK